MPPTEEYGLYIDGDWHGRERQFEVRDPATNEPLATVASASVEDAELAIEAAATTFEEWRQVDHSDRGSRLLRAADVLRAHSDELARTETLETGRPLGQSKRRIGGAIGFFDYYGGMADKIEGETIPIDGDRHSYTVREPLGVTGHIVPWNSPSILAARSFAPALACGNTVVAKPSPDAPLTVLRLAELLGQAGLPAGAVNVVPDADAVAGKTITESDTVAGISFTGSRGVGKQVLKTAADTLTPVDLELGGNTPCIVFPDADLDAVVEDGLKAYDNAGQICFTISRFFVHADIYDEFADRFAEAIDSLVVGAWDEEPDVGPVISPAARDRLVDYVDGAVSDGARLLAGGTIPREDGNFYRPTLIDQVDDTDPVACDELFGPVKTLHEFEAEAEVVARANDTEYGLYAVIWTNDVSRVHRLVEAMEAGVVAVNEFPILAPQTPFGGYKESGIGRTKGHHAIEHFTQVKSATISYE
ncbi:aldehyde dehydrogenase family protein [Haloarchaeobius litoreus]|uniref:Aldehyde dehydrogenase family protein n=1 Tax=Haloarchaeobius litoreus TaxID=755306 RepID=A0ABD6DNQ5_9EURY|nr:aldehyde dehydrogenase family protein [Haloarchaeobius litoreus]